MKQIEEMCDKYSPFLIWWDPGTGYDSKYITYFKEALDGKLNIYIHNDRLQYNRGYGGDYGTGERTICLRDTKYGEACFTMNDTWGYSDNNETKYFGEEKVFKQFMIYSLAYGQNCLMNIGPKKDGSIPDKQLQCLDIMKQFATKYGSFKNYERYSYNTMPRWGYILKFPEKNQLVCYVIAKGNKDYADTTLDGINCSNITSVEILTPGTGASYEIVEAKNTIEIHGLALDADTKVGVVRITYSLMPVDVDAASLECNEWLTSRTVPMKSGLTYDFTNYRYSVTGHNGT